MKCITFEHNVLSLQASDLSVCLNTQKKISAAHAFATQFSFYFYGSECHIFHFVGWWDLCDGYTGMWQCLVPAILYQSHHYSIEPFGKVCMQVINVPLEKGMSFNWCVHSSYWPNVYMFKSLLLNNLSIHFSAIFPRVRSWWISPEKSVQSSTCLSWHMRCVHLLLHGPRCVVIVAICSSWGSACYHTVHCLKEMNDYGKLMPFGYFLRRFASWNLIPFIFLFYLHKECRLSLLSYHWDGLDKLEWQIKRQIKIGL